MLVPLTTQDFLARVATVYSVPMFHAWTGDGVDIACEPVV
jgi:hypothetical protein